MARLAVVVEELVTNLHEHGGVKAEDQFSIAMRLTASEIELVLVDSGNAFDPRVADLGAAVPDRGGGAGLKLVRAWASDIDYSTEAGENRLAVRLPRHSDPRSGRGK